MDTPKPDPEYPSIPGKPETYSPTYNKFHAMLCQKEPLSKEQASEVYDYINQLVYYAVPEGGLLMCLYDQLGRERHKGLRCSVCGKYQDDSCILGC